MEYEPYKILLEKTRKWYKTIGTVYCPCLQEYVVFNSKDFYHLRYDSSGRERSIDEQVTRLNLLPLAIPLIKQSKRIYEYRTTNSCRTQSWALHGNMGGIKLKVVLKKNSDSHIIYFSVMKTE
jgi:hypothetical protein